MRGQSFFQRSRCPDTIYSSSEVSPGPLSVFGLSEIPKNFSSLSVKDVGAFCLFAALPVAFF
jgi:hypothetical protein